MKKIFLAVMMLFLMTSCWDKVYDEGGGYYDHISYRGSNKYWYSIYTIPHQIMIDFPIQGKTNCQIMMIKSGIVVRLEWNLRDLRQYIQHFTTFPTLRNMLIFIMKRAMPILISMDILNLWE